ncbi:DNA methylase, putative [Devosia sp. DBB001]|nr:DNA methylase, putative [Devosia sp. DBB001]
MSTRAKALRSTPTDAEKSLWRLLYTFRTSGYHFRKQSQVGDYFPDFVCHHAHLIIEVDGGQHYADAGVVHDATRDAFLRARGYDVLRFSNLDVLTNPDGVFDIVAQSLEGRPVSSRHQIMDGKTA